VSIIHHPDVRRMLSTMRAYTEGARALAYVAAAHSDLAHAHPEEDARKSHQAIYEYLVPIVKGFSTEMSVDVASLGVQVHGGMGFIEETGAAQHYRDARILPIYEGTTAIQANDLVGRKTVRDGGRAAQALLAQIDQTIAALTEVDGQAFKSMHRHLSAGSLSLARSIEFVVAKFKSDPNAVFAGSVPYLRLAGTVLCGWQMARAMLASHAKSSEDERFHQAKIATAEFYAEHILSHAPGIEASIISANGKEGVLALSEDQF
jgi:3-(methylthio)propanoyl-CoA dehydrogenase